MHFWSLTRSPESGKKASENKNFLLSQFPSRWTSARPPPPTPPPPPTIVLRVNSGGLWWHFKFVERLDFWSDDSITVHFVEVLLHFRATTADLTKMVVRLLLERL